MRTLYVVASPIGNLGDASPRMRETLASCDLIAAEDTRVTAKLLSHFDIHTKSVSYYRHNENFRAGQIIERMLSEGIDVALISDAGTPCISDPGYAIVKAAAEAGITVVPICGPSAVAAALSVCGFKIDNFGFYGFLPRVKKDCAAKLAGIARSGLDAAVAYESPRRIKVLMQTVAEILPDRQACLCCDLSKYYETILRGLPAEILAILSDNPKSEKGEYTLVIDLYGIIAADGAVKKSQASAEALYIDAVIKGMSHSEAAAFLTSEYGIPRNAAYQAGLKAKEFLK